MIKREKSAKRQKKNLGKETQAKIAELWEENKLRRYFVRLFGKYDVRNEEQFIRFGKWLIFIVLCLMEILLFMQHLSEFIVEKKWVTMTFFLGVELLLTISEGMKLFVLKDGKVRKSVYGFGTIAACSLMFFGDNALTLVIYVLILTEFYIDTEKNVPAVGILCSGCLGLELGCFSYGSDLALAFALF